MSWQAIASSAVGESHRESGICQDAVVYKTLNDDEVIIGAISDGMGSAKHAQIGSCLAVKVALSELIEIDWQPKLASEKFVFNIFSKTLQKIRNEIASQAKENNYNLQDLACTLIVFVAHSEWLIAMQIGDGLLIGKPRMGDYELLIRPSKGEYANETVSITDLDIEDYINVIIKHVSLDFICAATDGIENLCLKKDADWQPYQNFFRPLEDHLKTRKGKLQKEKELENFLNSERINKNTDDDKTILICSYQKSKNNPQKGICYSDNTEAINYDSQDEDFIFLNEIAVENSVSNDFQVNTTVEDGESSSGTSDNVLNLNNFNFKNQELAAYRNKSIKLEEVKESIMSELFSQGYSINSLNIKIKKIRRKDLFMIEVWFFFYGESISKKSLHALIQRGLLKLTSQKPRRVRVFSLSLDNQSNLRSIKYFHMISLSELFILLFFTIGIYCCGIAFLYDLFHPIFPLGINSSGIFVIMFYSLVTIPLLTYGIHIQLKD
jgi:hypothetical protein